MGEMGYIEDFVTPPFLRAAQVVTVWEGTGNILGLEVLRLIFKFNVYETFFQTMADELNKLSNYLRSFTDPVEKGLKELASFLQKLVRQPEDVQTYYAKRAANLMCDIYLSIYTLI
jgi:acyl-CoA dehydrogenase